MLDQTGLTLLETTSAQSVRGYSNGVKLLQGVAKSLPCSIRQHGKVLRHLQRAGFPRVQRHRASSTSMPFEQERAPGYSQREFLPPGDKPARENTNGCLSRRERLPLVEDLFNSMYCSIAPFPYAERARRVSGCSCWCFARSPASLSNEDRRLPDLGPLICAIVAQFVVGLLLSENVPARFIGHRIG